MKSKIALILAGYILLFIVSLFSCDEHNECGSFPDKFKIMGLDWGCYQAKYENESYSNLVLSNIENNSVDFNFYTIKISLKQETYFAQKTDQWNFILINSTYACSPKFPQTDERIEKIVIKSIKDFNSDHLADSNLSDLFDVVVLDYSTTEYLMKYSLNEYVATNPAVPTQMTLILKEQPDLETDFAFKVEYYQDGIDFDYFEFETNSISINRRK